MKLNLNSDAGMAVSSWNHTDSLKCTWLFVVKDTFAKYSSKTVKEKCKKDHTETDQSCYQMYKKVQYIQHLYVRNNHR